jgi:hypothetical protein
MAGCLYVAAVYSVDDGSRSSVASNTWTAVADLLEEEENFLICAVTIGAVGPAEEQDLFDSLIAKASGCP